MYKEYENKRPPLDSLSNHYCFLHHSVYIKYASPPPPAPLESRKSCRQSLSPSQFANHSPNHPTSVECRSSCNKSKSSFDAKLMSIAADTPSAALTAFSSLPRLPP